MKYILIFLVITSTLYAKKDFYYSFIDGKKEQIEHSQKEKIILGNDKLKAIDRLVKDGKIDDALEKMVAFRESNKINILKSTVELLYSEILYKTGTKKNLTEGATVLEKAINTSVINEGDLLEANVLLVKLFVQINKIKEAKYYAESIKNIFKDPLSLAYGKISEAYIDTQGKKYSKAINTLYGILLKTDNLKIATVVADELYDVYILSGEKEKAYDLASKVLEKNIDYYANDSYLALIKVDKLIKAKMPFLAIKILNALLDKSTDKGSIADFKFRLANTYMTIDTTSLEYILEAKEYYKDLISSSSANNYKQESKIALDEILLREGKITPSIIIAKYRQDEAMQDKALLQELLNFAAKHDYTSIAKFKNVYKNIKISTANRFGYKDIKSIFAMIDAQMIKYYLENDKCKEINELFKTLDSFSIKKIVKESNETIGVLNCMLEDPSIDSFNPVNDALKDSKNGLAYVLLEKISYMLQAYDKGIDLTKSIDMLNDDKIKSIEFLDRFLLYGALNNSFSMDKFFMYAKAHPNFIEENKDNPPIIDFYYQYYLYLLKEKKEKEATKILKKLYATQYDMKVFVYSPYVEMQLASERKLNDDYNGALRLLDEGLKNPRRIRPNDLVQIYYQKAQLYKIKKQTNLYKDMIDKCKAVDKADNLYKDMCSKL
jgi:hypothetical protein